MANYDFQIQMEKNASMVLKSPADGSDLQSFKVAGLLSKGCVKPSVAGFTPTDTGMRALANQPGSKLFESLYSYGDFYIDELKLPLSMKQNPHLTDSGVEVRDDPANAYPTTQYWSMYAIFTLDASRLIDPKFKVFNVANKEVNPIRLRCHLNKPWGEEIPIRYELLDGEIPLYPWDSQLADFSTVCPITAGAPKPLAVLRRDGDNTMLRAAWTAATQTWRR
jgi:hypothetical protein